MYFAANMILVSAFLSFSNGYEVDYAYKYEEWHGDLTKYECDRQCQDVFPGNSWSCWDDKDVRFLRTTCTCRCQRECVLKEIYDVSACDIEDIPTIKNDVAGKIKDVVVDFLIDSAIGPIDEYTGGLIAFGKSIFDATSDENVFLNRVIDDMNRQNKQLVKCMGEKIDELKADDVSNHVERAFISYEQAAEYEHHHTEIKSLRHLVDDAWLNFHSIVSSEFGSNDLNNGATYFKKNLAKTQDMALLFALTVFDYLLILKTDGDKRNYAKKLDDSFHDFDNLRVWVYTAQEKIVDDMWAKMHELPCRNDHDIVREVAAWKERFEIANIDPIERYIAQLNDLLHRSPILEGMECEVPQSIFVLSVDHSNGVVGEFFNFNKEDVEMMLNGRTDWDNEVFTMRNQKTGATEQVTLWDHRNGGSIGNGHGRRYKYYSAGDWRVGDVLNYRPGDYSACADGLECRADTSCLDVIKGRGCDSYWDRDACLSSKDGRASENYSFMNDPCVWCGGSSCTTNNDNKCEPETWLFAQTNRAVRSSYMEFASAQCSTALTCQSCPDGYFMQEGDIEGWGIGGGRAVASCQECANFCSGMDNCKSFECSPTELRCHMNEEANPSQEKYKDYMFCTKE